MTLFAKWHGVLGVCFGFIIQRRRFNWKFRPYLKKIRYADCVGGASGDVLVITIKNKELNSRYLYQVLADDKFFDFNMRNAKGSKMPREDKNAILSYKIPLPPLQTQQNIVNILDTFDTLTPTHQRRATARDYPKTKAIRILPRAVIGF